MPAYRQVSKLGSLGDNESPRGVGRYGGVPRRRDGVKTHGPLTAGTSRRQRVTENITPPSTIPATKMPATTTAMDA